MKINRIKVLLMIVLTSFSLNGTAVQVGNRGVGEVLIYPFYTVNNNLNTLYSIVNTSSDTKALSIRFREGEIGHDVMIFNVYLSAYDVWTGALIATESTIPNHDGEPSIAHVSNDSSCAPFLNKGGQEFLPYIIDLDQPNNSMQRATEGFLEVVEMGVLSDADSALVDHGTTGVPANCMRIEMAWQQNDQWDLDPLEDPTGGLSGSASIIDVAEGISLSYDAIALENFWQQAGMHTEPGSLLPNLSSANPESSVLLDSGGLVSSEWSTGFEAVSAVLMNTYIYNEYAYDSFINGQSEWVITLPTKKFHVSELDAAIAPFTALWNGEEACETFELSIYDREEQVPPCITCLITPAPPPPPPPALCFSGNVLEFDNFNISPDDSSRILGSSNKQLIQGVGLDHATENGWASLNFDAAQRVMTPMTGSGYRGLPVTGFAVQKFTNAGAAEGLLAQYGSLFVHKGLVVIEE